MKTGIVGMAGLGAIGAMGNLPGMPEQASGISSIAAAGVTLGMVGGLVDISQNIMPKEKKGKKTFDIKW